MNNINNVRLADMWPVMKEQLDAGKTVRFAPRGISMLPMLRQGIDTVVLKKAPDKLKKYDLPLYLRENGQFVLHRVVKVEKASYVMCGDNQYMWEYGVKHENILAVAIGFYRDNTYVDCSDKKYYKYCIKQVKKQRIKYYITRVKHIVKKMLHIKPKTVK